MVCKVVLCHLNLPLLTAGTWKNFMWLLYQADRYAGTRFVQRVTAVLSTQ